MTAPVRLPAQQSSLWEESARAFQLPRALQLPACSRQARIMTWRKHTLPQGRAACPLPTMQPGRPWRQCKQGLSAAAQQLSLQNKLLPQVWGMNRQQELHIPQVLQSSLSVLVRSRSRRPGPTAAGRSMSPTGAA